VLLQLLLLLLLRRNRCRAKLLLRKILQLLCLSRLHRPSSWCFITTLAHQQPMLATNSHVAVASCLLHIAVTLGQPR
jgi:hypothetical protein